MEKENSSLTFEIDFLRSEIIMHINNYEETKKYAAEETTNKYVAEIFNSPMKR